MLRLGVQALKGYDGRVNCEALTCPASVVCYE